jgi:hypothetical protein
LLGKEHRNRGGIATVPGRGVAVGVVHHVLVGHAAAAGAKKNYQSQDSAGAAYNSEHAFSPPGIRIVL